MRISEIISPLFETPLPDDWDSLIFNQNVSFAQRVTYARERAQQVGVGSSRVVFEIPYQGRKTALKIAMNNKGKAQNEEESRLFEDWYLKSLDITIPMIDYDDKSSYPTWIHTEYATRISQRQLEGFFDGVSMWDITTYLEGNRRGHSHVNVELPESIHENEYFMALQNLVMNYDMPAGDLQRKANWGLYKGKPVIIDLGFTSNTEKLYTRQVR